MKHETQIAVLRAISAASSAVTHQAHLAVVEYLLVALGRICAEHSDAVARTVEWLDSGMGYGAESPQATKEQAQGQGHGDSIGAD